MRPRNVGQAAGQARRFLEPKLRGLCRATRHKHLQRTERIAELIFERWGVGVHGWRVKHLRWLLEVGLTRYSLPVRYDYWTTMRHLVEARGKTPDWLPRLNGHWARRPQRQHYR